MVAHISKKIICNVATHLGPVVLVEFAGCGSIGHSIGSAQYLRGSAQAKLHWQHGHYCSRQFQLSSIHGQTISSGEQCIVNSMAVNSTLYWWYPCIADW